MGRYFAIRRIPLVEGVWERLCAPIDCSYIAIENGGVVAMRLREDKDDAATEKRLAAGAEFGIQSPVATWGPTDLVLFITSGSGNGLAVVTFTR